jgi:hypothetical protein
MVSEARIVLYVAILGCGGYRKEWWWWGGRATEGEAAGSMAVSYKRDNGVWVLDWKF